MYDPDFVYIVLIGITIPILFLGVQVQCQNTKIIILMVSAIGSKDLYDITAKNMDIAVGPNLVIRDVWNFNLKEEFRTIRALIQRGYHFVAIDTEFPGAPLKPIGTFRDHFELQFQTLKINCDCLRIIQLGLTFLDENGNPPSSPGICTWQFNFKFSLDEDMFCSDSIDFLQSSGIQFQRMEKFGIDQNTFSELLATSGLVSSDTVRWISFHSGYDFGYMFRIITGQKVPAEETDFYTMMKIMFPNLFDLKFIMKFCQGLKGGLQELANGLGVPRLGPAHQAGSDSLVTALAFFSLRKVFFTDIGLDFSESTYNGRLYGIKGDYNSVPVDKNPLGKQGIQMEQMDVEPELMDFKYEKGKHKNNGDAESNNNNSDFDSKSNMNSSFAEMQEFENLQIIPKLVEMEK